MRAAGRGLARGAAAGAFLALLAVAVPATATPPSTWADVQNPSAFQVVLVLFLIPLGLGLVIALLAALPSLVKGDSYEPGQAWRSEGEWFGGPRKGVEGAQHADPAQLESAGDQGGGGARF